MTVAVNDRSREYTGNGVATVFNGPMAYATSHVLVFLIDANDVVSLVPSSGYEVTGLGRTGGTTVTMGVAPALNVTLLIQRLVPYSQDTDITNLGAMLPEALEKCSDLIVMQVQQLLETALQLVFTGTDFAYDFKQHRGINLADPINPQDVMNLRSALNLIEEGGGGAGSGVSPLKFDFLGDGVTTDFQMVGAQVDDPVFYDVVMELTSGDRDFVAVEPAQDFIIVPGAVSTERYIRFLVAPGNDIEGFIVMRGYARAASTEYVVSLDIPTFTIAGTTELVSGTHSHGRLLCTNAGGCELSIRENTGSATLDMATGDYFTAVQLGPLPVEIVGETVDVTIVPPTGFQAKTRAVGASISAVQDDFDTNTWHLSGDLMATATVSDSQAFIIAISDETTNLTTGLAKATFRFPYGFLLDEVRAGLSEGQTAGAILTFDVKNNGVSIFDTLLSVDNDERTSTTAATPAVFADDADSIADDDEFTIDITQVGTAGAKGAKISFIGRRA
jgi:hypothetical protein